MTQNTTKPKTNWWWELLGWFALTILIIYALQQLPLPKKAVDSLPYQPSPCTRETK